MRITTLPGGHARFSLDAPVRNRDLFGEICVRLIDRTHCGYIAPTMLRIAVARVVAEPVRAQNPMRLCLADVDA